MPTTLEPGGSPATHVPRKAALASFVARSPTSSPMPATKSVETISWSLSSGSRPIGMRATMTSGMPEQRIHVKSSRGPMPSERVSGAASGSRASPTAGRRIRS